MHNSHLYFTCNSCNIDKTMYGFQQLNIAMCINHIRFLARFFFLYSRGHVFGTRIEIRLS